MKAAYFRLRNVMGLSEWEIKPGALNLIEGDNAEGKTTLLEGLKALFTNKHDATLLNEGADKGELLLLFDDGSRLERTITAEGSKTSYQDADSKRKSEPTEKFLRAIHDAVSLNPISIIRMEEEELREKLLDILPLSLDPAQLQEAVGCAGVRVHPERLTGNAVRDIQALHDYIYDERTSANRAAKEKRATASQLLGSLPNEPEAGAPDLAEWRDTERTLHDSQAREIQEAEEAHRKSLADINAKYSQRLQEAAGCIAAAEAAIAEKARGDNTRRIISDAEKQADALEQESKKLSKALSNLDQLRLSLFDGVPVQGLEVAEDGSIRLDGVPWSRVNTARKIAFALAISVLRAQESPVKMICLDDAEHLGTKAFGELEQGIRTLAEKGFQFFISRVRDCELRVETK